MPLHDQIQNAILQLDSKFVNRILRVLIVFLVVVGLAIIYDWSAYHNFSSQEAMDSAQLARNIAEGRGYTTYFIRPFSVYLLQQKQINGQGNAAGLTPATARLDDNHPDLANPPVYPVFLAGLMKAFKFNFTVETTKSFWSFGGYFQRYQPEFIIALANQVLLIGAACLTFFIARKLFDLAAAWLSGLLVIGSNLLWKFSVSGLSTILLLDIFLLLIFCLLMFEKTNSQAESSPKKTLLWIIAAGFIIGLGMLTRYSFGWLLVPSIVYLLLFGGTRRIQYVFALACTTAVLVTPWILRNLHVSGTLFGVAGYNLLQNTAFFQGTTLESSTHPFVGNLFLLMPYLHKLQVNLRLLFENDLLKFNGSWLVMLFFTGLLLGFRSQVARRIRYFVMFSLVTFVFVESLGRTHLSDDMPVLNSENLLVLLAPMTFIYGAVFFLILLDQMKLAIPQLRYAVMAGLVLVGWAMFICQLCPPKANPIAYPPYNPPDIKSISNQLNKDELIMSDVPWAVAWYGQRECISLTLNPKEDFFAINDYIKPVNALYLTPKSMDGKYLTDMAQAELNTWGHFIFAAGDNHFPEGFPLRQPKILNSGFLLTDRPFSQN
jgi:hypothetical protein